MFERLKTIEIENQKEFRSWLIEFLIKIFFFIGIFSTIENYIQGYYYNLIPDFIIIISSTVLYFVHKKRLLDFEKIASIGAYFAFALAYLGLLMYILEIPPKDFHAIFFWIFPVIILSYILKPPKWALTRNIIFFIAFIITLIFAEIYYQKVGKHTLVIFSFVYLFTIFGLYLYATYVRVLNEKLQEKHKKAIENERKFKALVDNVPIGIAVVENENIIYLNKYMFPISAEEKQRLENILKQENIPDEINIKHKGKNKKFLTSTTKLEFDNKKIKIVSLTDITKEIELRNQINKTKQFFETIAEKSPIGIVIYKENIEYVNKRFLEKIGYSENEVVGKYVLEFIPDEYADIKKQLKDTLTKRLKGEIQDVQYVIPVRTKSGIIKWFYLTAHTIKTEDELKGMAVIIDITEKKKLEEKVFTLENLDLDTGLPNRKILLQEADFLIKQNQPFGVIVIDINGFIEIKKIYGEENSKKLIQKIISRIQDKLPNIMLGKIGIDRFVIIKTISKPEELTDFIYKQLLEIFEQPFNINGTKIPITVNIGVSIYPWDGDTASKVCSNAEFALKLSKLKGKKEIEFFSEETKNTISSKLDLISKLKEAVEKEEFNILYQPKVYLKNFKFAGCEALIRWKLPPSKFLPVLSEEKMMTITHKLIFTKIFNQQKQWLEKGFDINVSLNLPFSELEKENFYEEFISLKNQFNIPAKNITIELTETEIMKSPQNSIKVLKKLKNAGFKIAIDDFGVGYSSLSYLSQIPADELKIDISFVKKIPDDKNIEEIVKIIVDIGKILNMKVTAEGIEKKEQYDFLKEIGCDIGQGFYISKPLTPQELEKFYKEHT